MALKTRGKGNRKTKAQQRKLNKISGGGQGLPVLSQKEEAIAWAREVIESDHWCIMDTETTGVRGKDQIVDIAIVSMTGERLFNSLILPTGSWEMHPGAQEVHGITSSDLVDSPSISDVYEDIYQAIAGKKIIAYNAAFDKRMLNSSCLSAGVPLLVADENWFCLMQAYRRFRQLSHAPALGGGHRALSDCEAALALVKEMTGIPLAQA